MKVVVPVRMPEVFRRQNQERHEDTDWQHDVDSKHALDVDPLTCEDCRFKQRSERTMKEKAKETGLDVNAKTNYYIVLTPTRKLDGNVGCRANFWRERWRTRNFLAETLARTQPLWGTFVGAQRFGGNIGGCAAFRWEFRRKVIIRSFLLYKTTPIPNLWWILTKKSFFWAPQDIQTTPPCGHPDFESAVTAQNDEFKAVLIARFHAR